MCLILNQKYFWSQRGKTRCKEGKFTILTVCPSRNSPAQVKSAKWSIPIATQELAHTNTIVAPLMESVKRAKHTMEARGRDSKSV